MKTASQYAISRSLAQPADSIFLPVARLSTRGAFLYKLTPHFNTQFQNFSSKWNGHFILARWLYHRYLYELSSSDGSVCSLRETNSIVTNRESHAREPGRNNKRLWNRQVMFRRTIHDHFHSMILPISGWIEGPIVCEGCVPSIKGRYFMPLYPFHSVYSSLPETQQLVACLCPWLMDIYECSRRIPIADDEEEK